MVERSLSMREAPGSIPGPRSPIGRGPGRRLPWDSSDRPGIDAQLSSRDAAAGLRESHRRSQVPALSPVSLIAA
eukprot:16034-Hanusia_phi.AAC.3